MTNRSDDNDRIIIPGIGALTRRGEYVLATLGVIAFLFVMGFVGGIER